MLKEGNRILLFWFRYLWVRDRLVFEYWLNRVWICELV